MKSKLISLIIFVLLFTTLIPNFIYASDTGLEVNSQNFDEIQNSYTQNSFEKLRDQAKAEINTQAGTKTKQIRETFSLGSALVAAVTTVFLTPVMIVSMIITIVTRGADNTFLSG